MNAAVLYCLLAGLGTGTIAWPIKKMKIYQFEQFWFMAMLVGLFLIPWGATFVLCPTALAGLSTLDDSVFIKANLFSMAWGIANMLYGICVVRIGASLTGAIMTGAGAAVGITVPLIFQPDGTITPLSLDNPVHKYILLGVLVILVSGMLIAKAGFGRDKALGQKENLQGRFSVGLIMVLLGGIFSAGLGFTFAYSEGPIREAIKLQGGSDVAATWAVWAYGLTGGCLINLLYPTYLMTKRESWGKFKECGSDAVFSIILGTQLILAFFVLGLGLSLALTSVAWGLFQGVQMLGTQGVGFISGEWKEVEGKPRIQLYAGLTIMVGAVCILVYAQTLKSTP